MIYDDLPIKDVDNQRVKLTWNNVDQTGWVAGLPHTQLRGSNSY